MNAMALERRDFLGGAALLALALGVPLAALRLSDLPADEWPTTGQRRLLKTVSQMVIPASGTAGAGDVGVGDFVALALAHGLEGTRAPLAAPPPATKAPLPLRADGSPRYLAWLEAELDARAGGFLAASAAARQAALAALDAESFPPGPPLGPPAAFGPNPWCKVKALILTGYYTSEEGAARELQYQLIPGRFDPDAPLHPGDRAWSSDWTAVDFG